MEYEPVGTMPVVGDVIWYVGKESEFIYAPHNGGFNSAEETVVEVGKRWARTKNGRCPHFENFSRPEDGTYAVRVLKRAQSFDIYLSGPMTGEPEHNFPVFNKAAADLRAEGKTVFNPAESFGGRTDLQRKEYMRADVEALLKCKGIALLPGWRRSKGAVLEALVALELALPVRELRCEVNGDWSTWVINSGMSDEHGNASTPRTEIHKAAAELFDESLKITVKADEACGERWPISSGRRYSWRVEWPTQHPKVTEMFKEWDKYLSDYSETAIGVPKPMQGNCLTRADKLTSGDRGADYGHPLDDYTRTGHLWGGLLHEWAKEAAESEVPIAVPPELAIMCMCTVKLSREVNKPKQDNVDDLCGYGRCIEMCKEEAARREGEEDATE